MSEEDARRSKCRYSPITTGSSTTCVQTQPTPRISTFSPRCSLQCSSSCAGSRSSQIVATIRDATAPLPMHTASCRALCAAGAAMSDARMVNGCSWNTHLRGSTGIAGLFFSTSRPRMYTWRTPCWRWVIYYALGFSLV